MLLALQTTADGIDDSTLDAVTLVLLVGFIVSMVALSVILARGNRQTPEDTTTTPRPERPEVPSPVWEARSQPEPRPAPVAERRVPVWLAGVTLSHTSGILGEATAVVERLLAARQARDLAAGVASYSPALRARLASELGVPVEELGRALETAAIEGEAPGLRSVELVTVSNDAVTVRAGYTDRSGEVYQLVQIDGRWLIDSIERV